jgi:phosphatidylserine decarboxylase
VFAPRAGGPLAAYGLALVLVGAFGFQGTFPFPLAAELLWCVGVGTWAFLAAFFRDPRRTPGEGIVSAADGRVREVRTDGEELLVSVFMNVSDVHVNRAPLAGTFARVRTAGSGYRPAYRPDADRNVSRTYELATALGPVRIVQITGVVARRLVSFVRPGDAVAKGDRFGMIVLGSRVDVVLPAARVVATVRVGERVRAGETPIARERP